MHLCMRKYLAKTTYKIDLELWESFEKSNFVTL